MKQLLHQIPYWTPSIQPNAIITAKKYNKLQDHSNQMQWNSWPIAPNAKHRIFNKSQNMDSLKWYPNDRCNKRQQHLKSHISCWMQYIYLYICIFVYLYICIFVLYCPQCSRQLITQGQLPCVTAKLDGITFQPNFVYIPLL